MAYLEHIPVSGSDIDDAEIRENFFQGPHDIRHELRVTGSITLGCNDVSTSYLYFFDGSSATARYLKYNDAIPWFEFNAPIATVGAMRATGVFGNLLADKDIYVNYNYDGGDEDAIEYFNSTNQYLMWDQGDQEFRFGGNSSVSLNIKGDQILIGNRATAPATGYKYLVFAPNSDGGIRGATPGIRYDYANKTIQFSNDGTSYVDFPYGGLTGSIDGVLFLGWTAYDKSMAVGHIYATGGGNANTPLAGQSYIGLDAKLDTNDPEMLFACGQSGTPITGSIRFDYSESEFVLSEDVRLYNVDDAVNKDLYIRHLTLSAASSVDYIRFDNDSFIESSVHQLHIEAPTVHISSAVNTSGSISTSGSIRVNDVQPVGSRVANIYFNDRAITQKTDDDMFQFTAERAQFGYGAGSGSGVVTRIEFNVDTSEQAALGGVNPYLEYIKSSGSWYKYDVNGLVALAPPSGSIGTVQTVSDQGAITTNSIQMADLRATGNLYANYGGGDADAFLYFYEGSNTGRSLKWDNADNRFEFNDDVHITGNVVATTSGSILPSLDVGGNLTVGGTFTGTLTFTNVAASGYVTAATSGSLFKDTAVDGDLIVSNGDVTADQLYSKGNVYVNSDGPDGDSFLYFYDGNAPAGQSLKWDESSDWFEFSDDVYTTGNFRSNGNILADVNVYINYNGGDGDSFLYFYDGSSTTGQSLKWDDSETEFLFSDHLKVPTLESVGAITGTTITGTELRSNGNAYINYDGPDGNSYLYFYDGSSATGQYLRWIDSPGGYFEFSDNVQIDGTLDVNSISADGGGGIFTVAQMRCASLRIDQTPTTAATSPTKYITIQCNSVTYRIPLEEVP